MDQGISLLLDQTTGLTAQEYRFSLLVRNDGLVPVLLPFPKISGLQFRSKRTTRVAQWHDAGSWLGPQFGGGITLNAGDSRRLDFRVRPHDVNPPENEDRSDYYRWCVELTPAPYTVCYELRAGSLYYDPDWYEDVADQVGQAQQEGVTIWRGKAKSNQITLLRTRPNCEGWPSTVIRLADAVSNGEACCFALHDALLEAGHPVLAEHFRDADNWHPQGCWVLDLILGKS